MSASEEVFADHPVNLARRKAGKPPVTNVWLWGQGSAPRLEPFEQVYGVRGAMITAVDLFRGLAKLIGWKRIDVPGATGYLDTDYAAKGRYAVEALKEHDLVCVHIEAPDEASHEGRADAKIEALEQIDRHIVGAGIRGLARLSAMADTRLARPSHARSHEDAQPRRRADGDRRQRHPARRLRPLRRSDSRAIEPRLSRGLEGDGLFYREEASEPTPHGPSQCVDAIAATSHRICKFRDSRVWRPTND